MTSADRSRHTTTVFPAGVPATRGPTFHGQWVRTLDGLGDADVAAAGGKAAGLAALVEAGLPVPPGFAVLAPAYRRFVEHHGLVATIARVCELVQAGDEGEAARAATELAARMRDLPVPDDVAEEIRAAYEALGRPTVAVRSSSVQEDLAGASFAGQYETVLGVEDVPALLAAVPRCWASAWGERVVAYRAAQGLGGDVDHAVVVQTQVAGERAGVVFTADPVTGRRDRVRVSGAWGLAPAVVDGVVSPDEWLVDAGDLRITSRAIADKAAWTVPTDDGVATVDAPPGQRREPSLADPEVAELARLGVRAQQALGRPQDLEWVADDTGLWLVQSRPITTLFPLPEPGPRPDQGLRVYVCVNRSSQGFVEPMTPMGNELWRILFASVGRIARGDRHVDMYPQVFHLAAGRIYADATGWIMRPLFAPMFEQAFETKDPLTGRIVAELLERDGAAIRGQPKRRLPWRVFLVIAPAFAGRVVRALARPHAAAERVVAIGDREVARQRAQAPTQGTMEERLRWIEDAMVGNIRMAIFLQAPYVLAASMNLAEQVERGFAKHVGADQAFRAVFQSPRGNPGTEMGRELLEVAQAIRDEGVEPTPEHPAVAAFLDRYGHRTVREVDIGQPRWRDDPSTVLGWIAEAAADPDLDERLARERVAVEAADQEAAETLARVRGRLRRAVLGWGLWRARRLLGLKERPKHDEMRLFALWRGMLVDIGHELVAEGRLAEADDVMFVTFADLRSDRDLRGVAAKNRRRYKAEFARTNVPRVLTSTGETFYGASPAGEDDGVLTGVPASPGVTDAPVRTVVHPQAGAIEPGEVLVTRSTDPTWTPVILRAGAVVLETGGYLQHAAIVAREQGIPAVTGIEGATEWLVDGQMIRVDGEAGTVTLLDPGGEEPVGTQARG